MNLALKATAERLLEHAEALRDADTAREASHAINECFFALHEAQDALNGPHHVEQRLDAQFPEIRL